MKYNNNNNKQQQQQQQQQHVQRELDNLNELVIKYEQNLLVIKNEQQSKQHKLND